MIASLLSYELARIAIITISGASLLSLAALSGARCMRRSAELLHKLLFASLLLVLMLPALSLVVPAWSPFPDSIQNELPVASVEIVTGLKTTVTATALRQVSGGSLSANLEPILWFGALWFAGFLIMAIRWTNDLRARHCILRNSAPGSPELLTQCAAIRRRLGMRRQIRLRLYYEVTVPMTWGLFRPVLMLPAQAVSWEPERLQIVLLHELAHVARLDAPARAVADLVSIIHWYNPLVHNAARMLHQTAELATDRVVMREGASLGAYIGTLVDIARSSRPLRLSHAAIRSSELERRVTALVENDRVGNGWAARVSASTLSVLLATVVLAAGVGRAEPSQPGIHDVSGSGAFAPTPTGLRRLHDEPEAVFGPRLQRMLDAGTAPEHVLVASRDLRTDAERQQLLARLLDEEPALLPSIIRELHRLHADAALQDLIIAICRKGRVSPPLVTVLVNETARLRSVAARVETIVAVAHTQQLGPTDRKRLQEIAANLRPSSRQRALASLQQFH